MAVAPGNSVTNAEEKNGATKVQSWASPMFSADPLDGRVEDTDDAPLHNCVVEPKFDLIGNVLRRQRDFESGKREQAQWLEKVKLHKEQSRKSHPIAPLSESRANTVGKEKHIGAVKRTKKEFAALPKEEKLAKRKLLGESHIVLQGINSTPGERQPYSVFDAMVERGEVEHMCTCLDACAPNTAATKKCYTCLKFDSSAKGNYCDECFAKRHPPNRITHYWKPISAVDPPLKQDWKEHMKRLELQRRDIAGKGLLKNNIRDTLKRLQEAKVAPKIPKQVRQAHWMYEKSGSMLYSIKTSLLNSMLREKAATMIQKFWKNESTRANFKNGVTQWKLQRKQQKAATKIQASTRMFMSRKRVRHYLLANLEEIYDHATGSHYYYNTRTRRSSWTRPKILEGFVLLTPQSRSRRGFVNQKLNEGRFKFAAQLTPEEAAKMVQSVFRTKRTRTRFKQILLVSYREIFNQVTGDRYYINLVTNQTTWQKPRMIRDCTIRRFDPREKRGKLPKVFLWNKDLAARTLQGFCRTYLARRRLQKISASIYQQVWSKSAEAYFYYNIRTGESQWAKPAFFTSAPTRKHGTVALPKRQRSQDHEWNAEEAATLIQSIWRMRISKKTLVEHCCQQFEKIYSPEDASYFYYNKRNRRSSWHKPRVAGKYDVPEVSQGGADAAPPRLPRRRTTSYNWTKEEAVLTIQAAARKFLARSMAISMCNERFQQIWLADEDAFVYYDKETQKMSFNKPHLLGRSAIQSMPRKESKRARKVGHAWTDEEAASTLQAMWRRRAARKKILQMCSKKYEQVWSEEEKAFYFYNTETGVSSWHRPKILREHDTLDEVVRKESHGEIKVLKRMRSIGHIWTYEEAALVLQGMWRKRVARKRIIMMCSNTYEQVWSEEENAYYFYNKTTGVSIWERPKILKSTESLNEIATEATHGKVVMLKRARSIGHLWTDEEAALVLQAMWRRRVARRLILQMCSNTYEQVWSHEDESFFFYNKETGTSSWKRPLLLNSNEELPEVVRESSHGTLPMLKRLRSIGHIWSDEEAALVLQGMWRKRVARKRILQMCSNLYEQIWSDEDQAFFFYNKETGVSSWERPATLKAHEDLHEIVRKETHGELPLLKRLRSIGHMWTDEEAALVLQGMWRKRVARKLIMQMCSTTYEQVWSDEHQTFFFYNTLTGTSSWEKPKLLREHGLHPEIAREESHGKLPILKRLRSIGHIWTDEEAALVLQSMWRKRAARRLIVKMCSTAYEQVWSDEHHAFFFYNKSTGESTWEKPRVLGATALPEAVEEETHGKVHVLRRLRSIGHIYTDEEAALVLQCMWRKKVARDRIQQMCSSTYEKFWSEPDQTYFFYNKSTGESSWEKPKLFASTDEDQQLPLAK